MMFELWCFVLFHLLPITNLKYLPVAGENSEIGYLMVNCTKTNCLSQAIID